MVKLRLAVIAAIAAGLIFDVQSLSAAEIRILSAVLMKPALEELGPTFERATGDKLVMSFGTASVIKERIQKDDLADLVILPLPAIEDLQKGGQGAGRRCERRSLSRGYVRARGCAEAEHCYSRITKAVAAGCQVDRLL